MPVHVQNNYLSMLQSRFGYVFQMLSGSDGDREFGWLAILLLAVFV